ncbi:MAG TPA: hypothetical protein VFW23_09115 [Tepidisphaeraceae bacterium]|nr:hypothetical protein [Tepidisphaeraceae bacterium]
MKKLMKIAVAGLNLLIVIALVVFWLRSYTIGDNLNWHRTPAELEIYSTGGLLRIAAGKMVSLRYPPPQGWEGSFWPFHRKFDRFEADLRRGTTLGFRYERWTRRTGELTGDARILTLPYWFLVVCCTMPLLAIARGRLRARQVRLRIARGQCIACGYDLRGSQGRCSECGRPIAGGSDD